MVDKVRLIRGSDGAVEKLKDMGDGTFAVVNSSSGGGVASPALPDVVAYGVAVTSGTGTGWANLNQPYACRQITIWNESAVDIELRQTSVTTFSLSLKAGTSRTLYASNGTDWQLRRVDQSVTGIAVLVALVI